jgi:hypothetical protein
MKNRLFFLFIFLAAVASSNSVHAATYRICLNWRVYTDDSGNGEDNYASGSLWKARGTRYTVLPASGSDTPIAFGYTEQSGGCFNLTASASSFRIQTYLEAKLGDNVKITTHSAGSDTVLWTMIDTGTLSSTSTNYLEAKNTRRTNIMGIAQYVAYSWLSTSPSGISNIHIRLRDEGCPGSNDNSSCASFSRDMIFIRSGGVRRKFNIGHEMGHMLYMKYRGGVYEFDCERDEGGAHCTTLDASHGSHAIHTKENTSCALAEGFAHFVAADAFNSHDEEDGYFYYYKTLYDPLLDVASGPTGGPLKFLETRCEGSDQFRGVELDWLRTFWNYHTDTGTKPTHQQIFQHVNATHDDARFEPETTVNVFAIMHDAAPNLNLLNRWTNLGDRYGINH